MYKFDLVPASSVADYPGHIIFVRGDAQRITGVVLVHGQHHSREEQPLESAIHSALLVRQRDARPIGVRDDDGLWPERLGTVRAWSPDAVDPRSFIQT
ncbi:hypothetical protein CO663_32320 [Rhizobium anhuiense]|uniref:hypothetical protein n=1 Tax=Rhizobium anhuiense TaxID=1184720 RepID=UPI000BEA1A12|nr:hypothetical protein [Rhizobium anhuiense]PDS54969.1 hypothetical protein CO663_32320 [Rhizobium anhuiense]